MDAKKTIHPLCSHPHPEPARNDCSFPCPRICHEGRDRTMMIKKKNAESGVQCNDVYLAEELVRVLDTLAVHLLVLGIGLDVRLRALSGVEESGGDGKLDIFFGHCCLQKSCEV